MLRMSPSGLEKRSATFRYVYFLITSVKFKSFRAWKEDGEPDPFVEKTYRTVVTERVEFTDIFEDVLKPKRTRKSDTA